MGVRTPTTTNRAFSNSYEQVERVTKWALERSSGTGVLDSNRDERTSALTVSADSTVTAVYTANGIMGDVDGDGRVTIADAVAIMRHALDLTHIPEQYLPFADVNGDGTVNLSDAVTVMRMAIGVM